MWIEKKIFLLLLLIIPSGYAATATVILNHSIGSLNANFYGTNTQGVWGNNNSFIDLDGDGSLDNPSNYTWHQDRLGPVYSNGGYIRADMSLDQVSSGYGTWLTSNNSNFRNINTRQYMVKYAYDNNMKVLFTAGYMPDWLSNTTTGWCTSGTFWKSCTPTNHTRFADVVLQFLDRVDCDLYPGVCEIELWNEPDLGQWLDNLSTSDSIKAVEYNKLYSAVYNYTRANSTFASIKIYGPGLASTTTSGGSMMARAWLGNFTNQTNGFFPHEYQSSSSCSGARTTFQNSLRNASALCTQYGTNCTVFGLGEWGFNSNSTSNSNSQMFCSVTSALIGAAEYNGSAVRMMYFQWATDNNNTLTTNDNWPNRRDMCKEPGLENTCYYNYYAYSNMTRTHPYNSSIVNSSIDDANMEIFSTANGSTYGITIINYAGSTKSVTVNTTGAGVTNWTDVVTGTTYSSPYGYFTLTVPVLGVVNLVGATAFFYQETANVSTPEGGLSTGSYGDEIVAGVIGYVYMNYSIPSNANVLNSRWQVMISGLIQNITIPSYCNNGTQFRGRLGSDSGSGNATLSALAQCQNNTGLWSIVGNITSASAFGTTVVGNVSTVYDGNWTTHAKYASGTWYSAVADTRSLYEEGMYWAYGYLTDNCAQYSGGPVTCYSYGCFYNANSSCSPPSTAGDGGLTCYSNISRPTRQYLNDTVGLGSNITLSGPTYTGSSFYWNDSIGATGQINNISINNFESTNNFSVLVTFSFNNTCPSNTTHNAGLVAKNFRYGVAVGIPTNTSVCNRLLFGTRNATNSSSTISTAYDMSPNTNYTVIFTYNTNNGNRSLFANGALVSSSASNIDNFAASGIPWYVGSSSAVVSGNSRSFNGGYIEEIALYNRTLSLTDAASHVIKFANTSGLVAYFPFNNQSTCEVISSG